MSEVVVIAVDNRDARQWADAVLSGPSWVACTPHGFGERGVVADAIHATPRALERGDFVELRARALVCLAGRPKITTE